MLRQLTKVLIMCNIMLLGLSAPALARHIVFHYKHIDKEFKPYTNVYYNYLKEYCKTNKYNRQAFFTIEMADEMENPNWIGVCEDKVNGWSIKINRKWWNMNHDVAFRQQLLNHELTHCLLLKDHVNDKSNYMYPQLIKLDPIQVIMQTTGDIYNHCNN
jgi:hypothetical protein